MRPSEKFWFHIVSDRGALAERRGGSIIIRLCKEHFISPVEFFDYAGVRDRSVVGCRASAIHRLREAGFNKSACARIMRCSVETIRYSLDPARRAKKLDASSRQTARRAELLKGITPIRGRVSA